MKFCLKDEDGKTRSILLRIIRIDCYISIEKWNIEAFDRFSHGMSHTQIIQARDYKLDGSNIIEPPHEKTNNLHMRKQSHRSALQ